MTPRCGNRWGASTTRASRIALEFVLALVFFNGAFAAAAAQAECATDQAELWLALPAVDVIVTGFGGRTDLPDFLPGDRLLFCGVPGASLEAALALPGSLDAAAGSLAQLLPPPALQELLARVDKYLCPDSAEDLELPAPARDYVRELANRWTADKVAARAAGWPSDYLRSTRESLPSTEQRNVVIVAVLRALRERSAGQDITQGCQTKGALPKARSSGGVVLPSANSRG